MVGTLGLVSTLAMPAKMADLGGSCSAAVPELPSRRDRPLLGSLRLEDVGDAAGDAAAVAPGAAALRGELRGELRGRLCPLEPRRLSRGDEFPRRPLLEREWLLRCFRGLPCELRSRSLRSRSLRSLRSRSLRSRRLRSPRALMRWRFVSEGDGKLVGLAA